MPLAASSLVKPPRLAGAPAAFECRRYVALAFGAHRELMVGEVVGVHVRAGIVDPISLNVDFAALRPVGRLCGSHYARQRDMFELQRVTYDEWRRRSAKSQA
jgi:flavin reductase (DIM6/NTAB) family NADH-FMN oxidoreductase RutF